MFQSEASKKLGASPDTERYIHMLFTVFSRSTGGVSTVRGRMSKESISRRLNVAKAGLAREIDRVMNRYESEGMTVDHVNEWLANWHKAYDRYIEEGIPRYVRKGKKGKIVGV